MSRRERAGDDGHPSRGSRRREGRCSLSWRVDLRKDCPGLGLPLLRRVASAAGGLRDVRADAKGVVRHDPIAVIPLSPMISSKGCALSIRLAHLRPARVRNNSHASTRLRNCHVVVELLRTSRASAGLPSQTLGSPTLTSALFAILVRADSPADPPGDSSLLTFCDRPLDGESGTGKSCRHHVESSRY